VDGKVDWMANGLPVEGDDGPFLGDQLSEVATCDVSLTVGDARKGLDGADVVIVVNGDGLALGEVDGDLLAGEDDAAQLLAVMRPVPSTVRPSVTVASLAGGGEGTALVTTSDGRLLGRAVVEAGDDHHHDHSGHDHEPGIDAERFEEELGALMASLEEHFQGREPSAEEVRAFLRDSLVAEGQSPEEAERFVDGLGS